MKSPFNKNNVPRLLKEVSQTPGWVLCVGAGISLPVFPTWKELICEIILDLNTNNGNEALEIINEFNADSIIQAAYNLSGYDEEQFTSYLTETLYKKIKNELSPEEWHLYCEATSVTSPGGINSTKWKTLHEVLDKVFKNSSLIPTAQNVAATIGTELEPKAIISFNVEPSLLLYLNSILLRKEDVSKGHSIPKQFDIITRSISTNYKDRIPFIYCHGFLPPNNDIKKRELVANEKLVFSENSYLELVNNSYSWQSSTFLSLCSQSRLIFLGLSLTDPNLRRWLSWVQTNRSEEIRKIYGSVKDSTNHYWINKHPGNSEKAKWIESTVAHLGVRLIWIDSWSEIDEVFKKIF